MISLTFLNLLFPPLTDMLVFVVSLVFATAVGITAFLLLSSGNIKNFKKNIFPKGQVSQLPIVTPEGNVVDSKEELDAHLEVLENKLLEKVGEIASSKTKINDAKESIDKLNTTQVQVKKYYIKLKEEIKKSEEDCRRLKSQIDDYRERRTELEKEMKKNEALYNNILGVVKSNDSVDTSQTSSKSSLSSGDSSASSYYDSSPHTIEGESAGQENGKLKNKCRRIKTRSKTATLSKSGSKDSLSKHSTVSNEKPPAKSPSKGSLPSVPNESSENLTRKTSESSLIDSSREVSRDNSKANLKRKSSKSSLGCNKSSSASSQRSRSLKGKCPGKICCCGSDKCTGTCNIARSLKLGLVKPKDILSLDVAEHVDVTTGKVPCGKDYPHKRTKLEESRFKKPSIPRSTNKF